MFTVPRCARRGAISASIALCLTASLSPSGACLNDRDTDTLAENNRALPGMVEVITGRFERNPPLYYRMRIARIEKQLEHNPVDFPLYDDIAVAYDRLGESKKALEWMAKKREQLEIYSLRFPGVPLSQLPDRWYRYYANTGTFRVHRWLHDGADRKRISEVKQARAEIAKAIAIKPDAHFGRETYQLQVMDWIIADGWRKGYNDAKEQVSLAAYVQETPDHPIEQGLAGLVVLGNAWESVDVFSALGYRLKDSHNLSLMSHLRVAELEKAGRKSLMLKNASFADREVKRAEYRLAGAKRIKEKYPMLRAEAEVWQKERAGFMMRRLDAGRHPDTDPTFWNGYRPKPAPSLSTGAFEEWRDKTFTATNAFVAVFGYLPIGIVTFLVVRGIARWRRRKSGNL